jgi:hypothetical protein
MSHKPKILILSECFYRYLLFLYPAGHRHEYGQQMAELFRDISRQTYRQDHFIGVLSLWLRLLPDLGMSAGIEHITELKGNGMRRLCAGANVDPHLNWTVLASAVIIAIGILGKASLLALGGSVWLAATILVGSSLAASILMEIACRARGAVIIPALALIVASVLPLLWLAEPERWLHNNPINAFIIIIAAYWSLSRQGRPIWPVYVVGFILAAAQLATALLP